MNHKKDIEEIILSAFNEGASSSEFEVNKDTEIDNNLPYDSLDAVELLMHIENIFDVNFKAGFDNIITVGDLIDELYLKVKGRKTVDKEDTTTQLREMIKNINLYTFLHGPIFRDVKKRFSLSGVKISNLVEDTIQGSNILHLTTVPDIEDETFIGLHLIILSDLFLFTYYLKKDSISFRKISHKDYILSYEVLFENTKEIKKVLVNFQMKENYSKESYNFVFAKEEGVKGALTFLRKYNKATSKY